MMITIENLTYTYPGTSEPAIRQLDFQVNKGEIFGFLGPSGAGKSTTQKILIGLLKRYEGQVTVFERDLASWQEDYYEKIGVSFEVPNHYLKLTAVENLTYFSSLYNGHTRPPQELLEMVGLENDGDVLVSQYSKGMKNRLTVARSLLHDPEILFLDEPTAGLDPGNARRIKDIIRDQQQTGKTIFLTTHDMSVADQLCNRIAFIVDGQIKLIDSPRTLKLQHSRQMIKVEYRQNGQIEAKEFPLAGLRHNADFLQIIEAEDVETIHTQEATLEDIFIQVTGRSLT